ncbi:MAG: efflux RND transporter permease subunit [Prolixibacteraceae bacterium]|jgi:HAE1 family hydrophobic/amphiphilic exporter-1|nr:efflux RND transporter permease subunit [Prolixibacteraceae bacterium]
MSIYKSAVQKPITTLLIFVGIVVFGFYSLSKLSVDLYPEMEFPAISVMTQYNGANAADIETNITKPIEDAMSSISDMKQVTSISRDNISIVNIEFEWETDLSEAANDIRDALSMVARFLPEDAEDPNIFKFNSSMMPILFYAVTAGESMDGLNKIIDEKVVNPLNKIDGVGQIGLSGAPEREILVEVDPVKLESFKLTVEQIGNALLMENMNMPSGNVEMGKIQYPLRVKGEFEDSYELENIAVGNYNGSVIFLKDVATVIDGMRDMNVEERMNGKTGARMFIMKQSGGNTVRIAKEVKKELEKIKKTLPEDVQINTIFDSSEFINGSISNLSTTLLYALIFVTLIVLLFLGRWRATLIIVITIPISLIVAFIYLHISGSSINIISLSSLSIAIGMVVDDAIVVLENISKHIERGSSPREAAIYATNEVWLAVIVTTLTVVAVFLPLTMIGGMTGILFRQLGWIVSITVTTSTLAAITLTPMLSSKLLRLRPKKTAPKWFSYERTFKVLLDKLDNFYGNSIKWALKHKAFVVITSIAVFISSFFLAGSIGTEFMPESDTSSIGITIELQTGTRFEESSVIARQIDNIIETDVPEVKLNAVTTGSDDRGGIISIFQTSGSNIIVYSLNLSKPVERDRSVWEIAEALRLRLNEIPEIVNFTISTSGGMGGGMMGSSNVEVSIYGYDFETTTAYARQIKERIESIDGAREVQISREKFKPELTLKLDREKLALNGLTTMHVSTAVRNRVDGLIATRFREQGDEYNVVVRFKESSRNSITDLENILISTPMGSSIRLKELGTIVQSQTPPTIERKRKQRIVTVSSVPYKISLGQLASEIQNELALLDTPQGVTVEVGGAYEDMADSFTDIGTLALLIIVLVFIVMASQFESFKMPLIIMISILFIVPGVILTLVITNTTLSIVAALGAVLLVGIVVKNGIVLVDYMNLMRDRGIPLNEAIIESGKSRLRPVLMTALTTMLGMLPMALSRGEGSEIWSPMGISVIGGLVFSTLVTMVLVPVVYAVMARKGERDKKVALRKKFVFMDK